MDNATKNTLTKHLQAEIRKQAFYNILKKRLNTNENFKTVSNF